MPEDIVIIGRIGAPFGVKGWVKVQSFTQPSDNIFNYHPWLIRANKQWQTISIAAKQIQHKQAVIQFENCHDREQAQRYTNCDIGISRTLLPTLPKDEFYWQDLVGLQVINQDNRNLGTVTQLMETGANDVLIVKSDSEEIAIPLLFDEVVIDVDLTNKILRVQWDPDF